MRCFYAGGTTPQAGSHSVQRGEHSDGGAARKGHSRKLWSLRYSVSNSAQLRHRPSSANTHTAAKSIFNTDSTHKQSLNTHSPTAATPIFNTDSHTTATPVSVTSRTAAR